MSERAEQMYGAEEVARLLGISRSTFYTIAFFKTRKVRITEGRVVYRASDVALYQHIQQAA